MASRRVGVISVDFQAGTAKFVTQIDQAKAKMREFGQHGVSNLQATSAALRVMEGNMTNNIRAAERFLAAIPGVGSALRSSFQIVGAVAFLGIIGEMGKKVYEFVKNTQEAPAKFNQAFSGLNASIRLANDELATANARLENDIAKLEGKRENNLSVALLEAKASADKLAESLDVDLEKLDKLLKEQDGGTTDQVWKRITGNAPTQDIAKEVEQFRAKASSVGTDPLGMAFRAQLYKQEIERVTAELDAANAYQAAASKPRVGYDPTGRLTGRPGPLGGFQNDMSITGDMSGRITTLQAVLRQLGAESEHIDLSNTNSALTAKKDALSANADNAALGKPFEDKMKALQADLDGVQEKLKAIGAPESAQVMAKAFGEAQKAIEEVNKALEKHHTQLTEAQKGQIRAIELETASAQAEAEWKTKLVASTASIDARIKSQEMLTAAIGKGYEATKAANVETRLMQELGEHFSDSEWMGTHAGDVSAMRTRFGSEYDAQNKAQVGESLQKLQQQISLERDLAAVQAQGAEAVRGVTLAHKLADIARTNDKESAIKLMAAEMQLYAAERQNTTAEEVTKLNQKVEATERLAAATVKGAEAVRQAKLANELAAIQSDGDVAIPGVLGVGQRGLATIGQAAADQSQKVAEEASRANRLQAIQDQIALLNEAKQAYGDTLDIDIAIRDLENQKLKTMSDQALALGGLENGTKAFLFEMESDWNNMAERMARSLYDALNGTVDGISDELAKLATGQYKKGGFGKMLQSQGQSLLKSAFNNAIHGGIGALAKHYGVKGPHKPLGTPSDPVYVSVVNQPGSGSRDDMDNLPWTLGQHGMPGSGGGTGGTATSGILATLGGILAGMLGGGGGAGGAASSAITYGAGQSSGGDIDPGTIYPVGEHGMEYFAPKVPGTIIPHGRLGSGGDRFNINVDARNAEVGVEARVMQALHESAVTSAMKAQAERARRTPRKAR